MPIGLQILVFVSTVFMVLAVLSALGMRRSAAARRRLGLDKRKQAERTKVLQKSRSKKERKKQLAKLVSKFGFMKGGDSTHSALRKSLMLAGYRSEASVAVFTGAKTALMILLPAAVALILLPMGVDVKMIVPIAAIIGMRLPHLWLTTQIRKRKQAITCGLPDALDLMVVCVEAGLGLDAAIQKVGTEISHSCPELGEEFCLVNAEIRIGRSRQDALRSLAERTEVEDIKSFVARLLQADKFGTSIARSLRVHAEMLRNKRKQRAEEAAAKTTVKLLFPLIFFIFPALFVVILGPAAINIVRTLGSHG